jgi:glycosyltransferase involved in cell wall biosynthesis
MPAYNHRPFIAEAIESVLKQSTPFPFELLIGEDASTDGTLAVAASYQKLRPDVVRIVHENRNVGMVSNLRRLIEQARGDYIAFCEGDDYWLPGEGLARRIALLEATPTAGLVHSNYAISRRVLGKWRQFPSARTLGIDRSPTSGAVFSTVFSALPNLTCTTVYRREPLADWLDAEISGADDRLADLCLSALCASKWDFAYLDEVTAVYRLSPRSATRSGSARRLQFELNRLDIYLRFYRRFGHRPDFDKGFEQIVYRDICDAAFWAGDTETFEKYAELADCAQIHRFGLKRAITRTPIASGMASLWEAANKMRGQAATIAALICQKGFTGET